MWLYCPSLLTYKFLSFSPPFSKTIATNFFSLPLLRHSSDFKIYSSFFVYIHLLQPDVLKCNRSSLFFIMNGNPKSSELFRQFQAALKRIRPNGTTTLFSLTIYIIIHFFSSFFESFFIMWCLATQYHKTKMFCCATEAKAKAMDNFQDSQTSMDQSGNHFLCRAQWSKLIIVIRFVLSPWTLLQCITWLLDNLFMLFDGHTLKNDRQYDCKIVIMIFHVFSFFSLNMQGSMMGQWCYCW